MKRVVIPSLAAAAVAGAVGFAFHSVAAADCIGASTRICYTPNPGWAPSVDPTGNPIEECVYVASSTCTPVTVPFPKVSPGSGLPAQNFRCYQGYQDCLSPY